jgi:hypothetical protein
MFRTLRWLAGQEIQAALAIALSLALAGCSGSSGGGGGGSTANTPPTTNVTLAGTMTTTTTASLLDIRSSLGYSPMTWTTVADLALYCVTFTNPPNAGTGTFDATGTFSVTVNNAADVPVGCFIVDATAGNAVVTTVTFTLGGTSLGSSNSAGASFSAGTHNVPITFDATTKQATADVSTVASAPSASTSFMPADITGEWSLVCHVPGTADADLVACMSKMPAAIFLDLITATFNGKSVYALGVWQDQATFVSAGKGEGMHYSAADFTSLGVTAGPTSLLPNSGATAGADPTLAFNGFTSYLQTSPAAFDGKYNFKQRLMASADVWVYLKLQTGVTWETGGSVWDGCNNTGFGPNSPFLARSLANLPTMDQQVASCLMAYLDNAGKLAPGLFIPQMDWGKTSDSTVNTGYVNVYFRTENVADAPSIPGRFALMDASLSGSSVMGHQDNQDTWNEWDATTQTSISCTHSQTVDIVFVVDGTTSATGYLTMTEYRTCGGVVQQQTANSFRVDMAKGAASLMVKSVTGTFPLNGKWAKACTTRNGHDAKEAFMIAGDNVTVVSVTFSTTDASCGGGVPTLNAAGTGYGTVTVVGDLATQWSNDTAAGQPAPTAADGTTPISATPTATQAAINITLGGTAHVFKTLLYIDDSFPAGATPNGLRLYAGEASPASPCTNSSGDELCLSTTAGAPIPQN